jgi:hypothetical protein
MASQGPRSAGNGALISGPDVNWSSPGNITASDNAYATAALTNNLSDYLAATQFGFSIPASATIDGVLVEIENSETASEATFDRVYLTKNGSSSVGSNRAGGVPIGSSDAYDSFGGASDLWGTSLTPAEVNASTFGVLIAVRDNNAGSTTVRIDHVRMTITYTPPTTPPIALAGFRRRRAG